MNIWIFAVIAGLVLMIGFFVFLVLLDRKRGNIDYVICQTFFGGQKWYQVKGTVDKKNDGTYMAEHVIIEGGKRPIGLFHQKHLKAQRGNRYMMLLEEWDVGRFRPLEYRGHIKGKSLLIRKIARKDETGKLLRDKAGQILYKEIQESIDMGRLKATPNHDIDWIVARKEKNRKLLIKKEEKWRWLPAVAAAGLLIISGVMLIVAWMYLADYSENLKTATEHLGNYQDPQVTAEIIMKVLNNQTQASVKQTDNVPPSILGALTGG